MMIKRQRPIEDLRMSNPADAGRALQDEVPDTHVKGTHNVRWPVLAHLLGRAVRQRGSKNTSCAICSTVIGNRCVHLISDFVTGIAHLELELPSFKLHLHAPEFVPLRGAHLRRRWRPRMLVTVPFDSAADGT
jgi:hypothetical protein